MRNEKLLQDFIQIESLSDDQFLKLAETLTRIGFIRDPRSSGKPRLSQICHVFHHRGKYYLVHFKQLFLFEGLGLDRTHFTESDRKALHSVVNLVTAWGLARPLEPVERSYTNVTVLQYDEKQDWDLQPNFHHNRLWKQKADQQKNKPREIHHGNRTVYDWV